MAPKGVRELPEVKALIAARATRFTVEVIEFDPAEGTAESRLASVRARLTKATASATASAGATTESGPGTTASATEAAAEAKRVSDQGGGQYRAASKT